MMKGIGLLLIGLMISISSFSQEITRDLPHFDKVRASSHINVVLIHGGNEQFRLEYDGVEAEKINYGVKNNIFEIYLDGAKVSDKTRKVMRNGFKQRESYYKNAKVTAYITYKELKGLEVRGTESLVCEDPLSAEQFTMKLYGETKVTLNRLDAVKLTVKLYGENRLKINSGEIPMQKYKLYGENHIETENIRSSQISAISFGSNRLNLQANDKISIFGVGEPTLTYSGNAPLKTLVIGSVQVTKI